MNLDSDALIDRRRLKRRLNFWRAAAIVFLVVAVVAVTLRLISTQQSYVATLTISGVIVDDPRRDQALRRIAKDDRAKALILFIDSPGGTLVGGEKIYRYVRMVGAKKPVVAVMRSLATSAGYMSAIAADRIVARQGTITGSIGVILQAADLTELLAKLGIKMETIKSGPLKAAPNPFEKMTDAARAATKRVIDDAFAMFVDMVADRRRLDRSRVLALADGRIFTGRQALAEKLIDALGGLEEARAWLAKEHKIATTLPLRSTDLERGFSLGAAVGQMVNGKMFFYSRTT